MKEKQNEIAKNRLGELAKYTEDDWAMFEVRERERLYGMFLEEDLSTIEFIVDYDEKHPMEGDRATTVRVKILKELLEKYGQGKEGTEVG